MSDVAVTVETPGNPVTVTITPGGGAPIEVAVVSGVATRGTEVVVSDTEPVDLADGLLWRNSTDNSLNQWDAAQEVWINLSHEREAMTLISTVAICGDSITNSCFGWRIAPPAGVWGYLYRSYAAFAAAILGHPYDMATNPVAMAGIPNKNFGWDSIQALEYATDVTAINRLSPGGNTYPTETRTPLEVATEETASDRVLLIGTNDLNVYTAAATLVQIEVVAVAMKAVSERVFLCSVLPRSGSGGLGLFQPMIDELNAGLPALCARTGCVLVPWHAAMMTSGTQNDALFYDATHPNMAGSCVMGQQLAAAMLPYAGTSYAVPTKGNAAWQSATPYPDTDTNLDGLADGLQIFYTSDADLSIRQDDNGAWWQTITENDIASTGVKWIYAPAMSGGTIASLISGGDSVRAVCRYEVVSGEITGISSIATLKDAGGNIVREAHYYGVSEGHGADGIIATHAGLMLTESFDVPAEAASSQLVIYFSGSGTIKIRQFGWIKEP